MPPPPPPPHHSHRKTRLRPWNGDVQELEYLGNGVSGLVFAIDSSRVAKVHLGTPRSVEDFETERAVYRRFNKRLSKIDCRYVLRCLDTENPRGLVFERCRETVRDRVRKTVRDRVRKTRERGEEDGQAVRWAKQAAKGMAWVHDCKVIQGDVGCHNMLLDSDDNLKLADFAGSSIDNSEVSVDYEVRSQLPDVRKPTKKSDIFALGSTMYEMATGHPPYEELSYKVIQNKYRKGDFPSDVDNIPELGNIIRRCWEQSFSNAWDVVRALAEIKEARSQQRRSRDFQHRSELFVDSAISMADTMVSEPEMFAMETHSSKPSRRHREPHITYVDYNSHHHKSRREKDGERQGRKKHSHGGFISWINRSIHPRTHYDKATYYH